MTSRHEPMYAGQTLAVWLHKRALGYAGADSAKAEDAIRHIGTNGLPYMVKMLTTRDSALKKWALSFARKQEVIPIRWRDQLTTREIASFGFFLLGPDAKPAVPILMPLLSDNDPDIRERALWALAEIGPSASNATPALRQLLLENDPRSVQDVRRALKSIDPEAAARAGVK